MPGDQASDNLPIFHITHWKAGSEWVRAVLGALAQERFVQRRIVRDDNDWHPYAHITQDPLRADGVYSPLYVGRDVFFEMVRAPHRRFIVIRDLRDTLVSWYFSNRYSHPTEANPALAALRERLQQMSLEEGLLYTMETKLRDAAKIQMSWMERRVESATHGEDEYIVRYEDIWEDQVACFARICEHTRLEIPGGMPRLKDVVRRMSFESRSGGRAPGEEDVGSHFRKGVPGDWRNHFTPRVREKFKESFGNVLAATGYESGTDW